MGNKQSKSVKNNADTKEKILVESKTMREELISNIDVLDKIKSIVYLTNDMVLSVEQIATYYEVSPKAINTIIDRHRDELEEDGITVLKGEELKKFKEEVSVLHSEERMINPKTSNLTILTKRAMLRIGMLLTTSFVAKKIRSYLLNIEESATQEQKEWAIKREAGKIERKRMTTAIKNYLPETPNKRFAYPNYTNMIYTVLFGKTAKELKQERNVKDNDLLRDSFEGEELTRVSEAETIVTALISLGFNHDYIKIQLQNKYKLTLSK